MTGRKCGMYNEKRLQELNFVFTYRVFNPFYIGFGSKNNKKRFRLLCPFWNTSFRSNSVSDYNITF